MRVYRVLPSQIVPEMNLIPNLKVLVDPPASDPPTLPILVQTAARRPPRWLPVPKQTVSHRAGTYGPRLSMF